MMDQDQRTLEQVYRSAVSGLYGRLRSNYDFLYRKFEDEGLKLIAEMSREYGLSVAKRAKAQLAKSGGDRATAVNAITLAAMANTLAKCALVFAFSSRVLKSRILPASLAIVLAGALALLFV